MSQILHEYSEFLNQNGDYIPVFQIRTIKGSFISKNNKKKKYSHLDARSSLSCTVCGNY